MSLIDKLKKASKGVVDAGAKTMLKTDVLFLEREIKARKQTFGIEIYDLMAELESEGAAGDKEAKIRNVFDAARKDIAVIQAKKECKAEEMAVLDAEAGNAPGDSAAIAASAIPPSSGTVLMNNEPTK